MKKPRILIGSSVCQKPSILERFLVSLKKLDLTGIDVTFRFIDDNQNETSSHMLQQANLGHETILTTAPPKTAVYHVDDTTHYWSGSLVLRVANLKNLIIAYAIENRFNYLFLIDSDLIINPNLILHLLAQEKDVISEIFWTSTQHCAAGADAEPSVFSQKDRFFK